VDALKDEFMELKAALRQQLELTSTVAKVGGDLQGGVGFLGGEGARVHGMVLGLGARGLQGLPSGGGE